MSQTGDPNAPVPAGIDLSQFGLRDDLYGDSDDDMEIDDDEDYEADPDLLAELNAVNKNAPAAKNYTVEELKLQLKAKQREAVQAKRAGDTTRAVALMMEAKELKNDMEAKAALKTSGPAPAISRAPSETKFTAVKVLVILHHQYNVYRARKSMTEYPSFSFPGIQPTSSCRRN